MSLTKAEEIALILKEAIASGELEPGSILRQEKLSEEFGVSRTPIREALRQLEALELVSFVGKRGVQVRVPVQEEIFERFAIQAALSGFAAGLASERMTKADVRRMKSAAGEYARIIRRLRNPRTSAEEVPFLGASAVRANDAFHDVYLDASGVKRLAEMARQNRGAYGARPATRRMPEMERVYDFSLEKHEAILKAFSDKRQDVRMVVEKSVLDSARVWEQFRLAEDAAGLGGRVSWMNDKVPVTGVAT